MLPCHRLDQTLVYGREYAVANVAMSLAESVGLVGQVEPAVVPLLFALTAERPLREIVADQELDAASALPTIRALYEQGFLERRAPRENP